MNKPWIIEDWMGKRVWPEESFDSFEEARGRISEYANEQTDHIEDPDKAEADYNGICEDLYAVEQKLSTEDKLEYYRRAIRAENISQSEIVELQQLAEHIEPGDVELLQWAGVPEFPDTEEPPTS